MRRFGRIVIDVVAGALVLVAIASWTRVPARFFNQSGTAEQRQVTDFLKVSPPTPSTNPSSMSPSRPCERETLIGTVTKSSLAIRSRPTPTSEVITILGKTNQEGAPQVLDLLSSMRDPAGDLWYRALLPIRPNGTTGYVGAGAVRLSQTPYRLVVDRRILRLTLWRGCERLMRFPIGLGKESTPTPDGTYYLIALLKPPSPNSVYGTYAYGLSAFSEAPTLADWEDGGIIGLHGTNDPSSIGKRESHGCIRMSNADIERLVALLPLGTPVQIR